MVNSKELSKLDITVFSSHNFAYRLKLSTHLGANSCELLFTPARHTCQASAGENSSPFKVCKIVVKHFSSVTQEDRTKLVE